MCQSCEALSSNYVSMTTMPKNLCESVITCNFIIFNSEYINAYTYNLQCITLSLQI